MSNEQTRIAELERELKAARRRNDDLRADRDETVAEYERRIEDLKASHEARSDTVSALIDRVQACNDQTERWVEGFDMVLNDKGDYVWEDGLIQDRDKWFNKYRALQSKWNRFVPEYNAIVAPSTRTANLRNMGRPLSAGPGQVDRIKAYRKAGKSLRWIAEEMELGLQTVRTVLDRTDGVDRATRARLERIAPDKIAEARARRSIKDIAALPKSINENLKRNAELIKAAKGLK